MSLAFDRSFELKTWDRMVIPFPFATCTVRYGVPFRVPPRSDDATEGARLQQEMDTLEAWAQTVGRD